jgi:hypothetical protein
MTSSQRDVLATPVVLVYWLMLIGGLLVYGLTQVDASAPISSFAALWAGAVGGTLLGQCLALRDFRLWITVLVIAAIVVFGAPLVPSILSGPMLWRAFVPAALCGYWSLGDRTALPACWFPAVIWMLSILDRSDATRAPDAAGAALLAGLAVLFLVFLRTRESRRVGLWRAVSPLALAPIEPPELLREPPARQLARAGWGLGISALTVAITAWIAPALWQRERLADHDRPRSALRGRPCCPAYDVDTERYRVKEYLDLGRGRDERIVRTRDGSECRICPRGERPSARTYDEWMTARFEPGDTYPGPYDAPVTLRSVPAGRARVSPAPAAAPSSGAAGTLLGDPVAATDSAEPVIAAPTEIAAPVVAGEPVAAESAPVAIAPEVPAPPPPQVASPPVPATPTVAPAETTQRAEPATPIDEPATAADDAPRRASSAIGPSILYWLMWLGIAALVYQVVTLALRPVRRLLALRHLRHPFWDETIAQQVSNSWQLALVGLRDAGWRPGSTEAPQELARRVGVEGLDRCATILERARHGIGIDADDLSAMSSSANTAYHAARAGLGTTARAIGWLRWPLT